VCNGRAEANGASKKKGIAGEKKPQEAAVHSSAQAADLIARPAKCFSKGGNVDE